MTDASLANVVFAAFPVAFAALTVTLYRPLLRKAGPAPPASGIPMSAPHPRMRAPQAHARTPTVLHHLNADSPCRSNPDQGDGRRTRPRLNGADPVVGRRRATWERQRRLLAPLTIGRPPRLLANELLGAVDAVRTTGPAPEDAIVGQPASPGRVSGLVRIVHGPGDFDRFQPGEVLVARATAPAWTPLFARAAAVVTDGGTLAAHASLVAREYGIPAVVATGNATTRLADGQLVTVDGAGTVHPTTDQASSSGGAAHRSTPAPSPGG